MLARSSRPGADAARVVAPGQARTLAALLLVLACLLPAPIDAQVAPGREWLQGPLRERLGEGLRQRLEGAGDGERISVGVVLREDGLPARHDRPARRAAIRGRQQSVLDALPAGAFEIRRRYRSVSGFAIEATPAVIATIAGHPQTVRVYQDAVARATLAEGVGLVGADVAQAHGFTGAGVTVAIVDSGIDTDHVNLSDDLIAEQCWCWEPGMGGCCPGNADTGSGPGSAEDDEGHGTAVSGIVTSPGTQGSPGVAPDAEVVALKVLNDQGVGRFSDIASALDWVQQNHLAMDIKVVNISIGNGGEYSSASQGSCDNSNTQREIRDLYAEGVVTFVSSGNDGHDGGISFPACVAEAISVGGVYDANLGSVTWCDTSCSPGLCTDATTAPDQFVCHVNSGTILDLLAPDWKTRTSKMGGGMTNFGGTSAASPYAAGLAALLLEQDPSRTPADIRTLMTSNGPLVTNPENGLSFPRTDVAALFAVCGDGMLEAGEDCDDGNTADGDCCSSGCTFEAPGAGCDDGDACTGADTCDGSGVCTAGPPVDCSDGLFCNGDETCDPLSGCLPGTPPSLDDGVACTIDACDELGDVVTHTPDDGSCADGAFCNGSEVCDLVSDCQPGTPPSLDDGVACTIDACDELGDVVTHTPDDGSCADGAFCNGSEVCDLVSDCQPGTPPSLDDGVACTIDACDELGDVVTHTPDDGFCADADPCTAESCDAVLGCVIDPVPGCPAALPSSGPRGLVLLAALLTLAGGGVLLARREIRA